MEEFIFIGVIIIMVITIKNMWRNDDKLIKAINNIPSSTLRAVQGSINPRKGKLGELLTLLDIKGEYDTIISLGKPIDFIGISKDGIDFIEVKTGNSKLTDGEKLIAQLISENKVNFKCVRYNIDIDEDNINIS